MGDVIQCPDAWTKNPRMPAGPAPTHILTGEEHAALCLAKEADLRAQAAVKADARKQRIAEALRSVNDPARAAVDSVRKRARAQRADPALDRDDAHALSGALETHAEGIRQCAAILRKRGCHLDASLLIGVADDTEYVAKSLLTPHTEEA